MKLGFNEGTCMKNSTLEQDIRLCAKYGYTHIEIRLDMLGDYLADHTLEDLKALLQENNVKPHALNAIEDINFQGEEGWKRLEAEVLWACKVSEAIDNPFLIVCPTIREDMRGLAEEDAIADSVAILTRLSDLAAPYRMKIAYEPIGHENRCVRSMETGRKIIQLVNRENIGLALDAFNNYLYNGLQDLDTIELIPVEKIFTYHLTDCEDMPLCRLDHCDRLFPGDGVIPLAAISEKLKKIGYDGVASIELFRPEYYEMNAEDVIRIAAEKAQVYI